MRRKDRELNIFSMSALDLFASALGAFILITLILLPYYMQEGPANTPAQQCPVPTPAPVCPVCPIATPVPDSTPAPACPLPAPARVIVADNLLVAQMTWTASEDVDMHVETPDGEFYYGRKRITGRPGKMIHDNTSGGSNAIEIWMVHNPTPGNYKVCYQRFSMRSNRPITVGGVLDKPRGRVILPTARLVNTQKFCVLEFSMSSDYTYTQIRP